LGCVLIVASLVSIYGSANAAEQPESSVVASIGSARSAREATRIYRSLFDTAADAQIRALKASSSDGLAVRANWEEVKRSVRHSPDSRWATPNPERLERFIGVIEGRLRTVTPIWWEQTFLDIVADREYNFSFRGKLVPTYEPTPSGVRAHVGVKLHGLRLEVADAAVTLPEYVIGHAGKINAIVEDGTCFLAAHHQTADRFKLFSLSAKNQEVNWSVDVWGASSEASYSGAGFHAVTLSVNSELLIVFGAATDCAYIEAFARSTGECRFRFSTTY
jgi:hypothetical protein